MNQRSNKYRSQMRTLGDILEVIMEGGREGVIVSAVSRRAKMAHYQTLEKCFRS